MNKRTTENSILKFPTVSSVSSDSIVKGIIDDIINTDNIYMNISRYVNIDKFVNIQYIFLLARRAYS
jgi:hypothetical protein